MELKCERGGRNHHGSEGACGPSALWKVARSRLPRGAALGHVHLESKYDRFFFHAEEFNARFVNRNAGNVCAVYADAMPLDHEQYYGFTKFAIELNELDASLKPLLPPTDTRLRVDQR